MQVRGACCEQAGDSDLCLPRLTKGHARCTALTVLLVLPWSNPVT